MLIWSDSINLLKKVIVTLFTIFFWSKTFQTNNYSVGPISYMNAEILLHFNFKRIFIKQNQR